MSVAARHAPNALTALLVTSLLAISLPGSALADFTSPVTVTPADDALGESFVTPFGTIADLEQTYVEDEYIVSGAATVYTYDDPPVRDEIIPLDPDVPYTTRMIVRRPSDPADFNGVVVVEWWNSTATFDTAPVWDASADYFARTGTVYVGVTNSNTAIDFLVSGCLLLGALPLADCGTRYAALSIPENGQAYEMMSQIAHLLKSDEANNPLYPDFAPDLLFHAGQSQQGGSMVTYATAFHFEANDGYFVQAAGLARPINFGPACGEAGSPAYPACTPRLEGDARLVRTDLPVPVIRAITETDMDSTIANDSRQSDTTRFRYYELTGAAHTVVHEGVEAIPGLFLADFCLEEINSLGDGPVFGSYLYNAMWRNMELQARWNVRMPTGKKMDVVDGLVVRDEFGNATGGLRLPQLDVPIATYGPHNVVDPTLPPIFQQLGGLFCFLSGTVTPLPQETLDELYGSPHVYPFKISAATNALLWRRYLLAADAKKLKLAAGAMCGLGFELVVVLPPLLWLARRKRAGRP